MKTKLTTFVTKVPGVAWPDLLTGDMRRAAVCVRLALSLQCPFQKLTSFRKQMAKQSG